MAHGNAKVCSSTRRSRSPSRRVGPTAVGVAPEHAPGSATALTNQNERIVNQSAVVSRFELRLRDGPVEHWPSSLRQIEIHPEIWVDERHLDEPHCLDLGQLVQSLHTDGWAEIFTCKCGVAGCAGIVEGIKVAHLGPLIQWSFRRPQSANNMSGWRTRAVRTALLFDRDQMLAAIQDFVQAARDLVTSDRHRFCWPVQGFGLDDLLETGLARPTSDATSRVQKHVRHREPR